MVTRAGLGKGTARGAGQARLMDDAGHDCASSYNKSNNMHHVPYQTLLLLLLLLDNEGRPLLLLLIDTKREAGASVEATNYAQVDYKTSKCKCCK